MSEIIDEDFYQWIFVLFEFGDIEFVGVIVYIDFISCEDLEMQELIVEINDVIVEYVGKGDVWIYVGNDDIDFLLNQFQGFLVEDDEFVWEC